MIEYYLKNVRDDKLNKISEFKLGCWVYVETPAEDELEKLSTILELDFGHLKDALDPHEVPRLEIEKEIPYIFTRVPFFNGHGFSTVPLLFVLGPTFILTISPQKLSIFNNFFEGKINFFTTQKIKLFIQFFSQINAVYLDTLNKINKSIYEAGVRLDDIKNKDVINFIAYEQTLNSFHNSLIRTNAILNTLLSGKIFSLFEKDKELIEDLFLASGQLIELNQNTLNMVRNTRESYTTVITNNLNKTIKLLTSLTIILTIPTIVASIYGMNINLPFGNSNFAFGIVIGIILLLSGAAIYIFYKKDWL